jgi:hypothetical protein
LVIKKCKSKILAFVPLVKKIPNHFILFPAKEANPFHRLRPFGIFLLTLRKKWLIKKTHHAFSPPELFRVGGTILGKEAGTRICKDTPAEEK